MILYLYQFLPPSRIVSRWLEDAGDGVCLDVSCRGGDTPSLDTVIRVISPLYMGTVSPRLVMIIVISLMLLI